MLISPPVLIAVDLAVIWLLLLIAAPVLAWRLVWWPFLGLVLAATPLVLAVAMVVQCCTGRRRA